MDIFGKSKYEQSIDSLTPTFIGDTSTFGGHTFKLILNPIIDSKGERTGTVVEWK